MNKTSLQRVCLLVAWVISLVALLGTLYGSHVLGYPVCHLCWYQRIGLYPLVIILGIAIFRDDLRVGIYAIPLALIAAVFASYQYMMQMIPGFGPIELCSKGASCSDIHLKLFGFITYPFLSITASVLIILLLIYAAKNQPL